MSKVHKVDLTLLKKGGTSADLNEYFVEMSRAVGMATGIMQEATGLIGDIGLAVSGAQTPTSTKDDLLSMFKLKGSN